MDGSWSYWYAGVVNIQSGLEPWYGETEADERGAENEVPCRETDVSRIETADTGIS